jgi:hypothetical protein
LPSVFNLNFGRHRDSVALFEGRMCGVSPAPTMQYLSVRVPLVMLAHSFGSGEKCALTIFQLPCSFARTNVVRPWIVCTFPSLVAPM